MRNKIMGDLFKYLNLLIVFITLVIIILLITGVIVYWKDGLSYIASNPDKYAVSHTILNDTYEVEINLDHLDDNKGKIVLSDGNNKIYISKIDTDEHNYRIFFRSHGDYSLNGGTLISGIKHDYDPNRGFTTSMNAKMFVQYNGVDKQASRYGMSGINYKDGDDFIYYIMPISAYQKGTVTIRLTELCKNTWTKIE